MASDSDGPKDCTPGTRPPLKKGQQVLVLATVQQDYGGEVAVMLEDWWPAWSEILVSECRVTPLPVRRAGLT